MKFRFVHAADLHLDTPFAGVGKTSPETAAVLREAPLEALDQLTQLAIERQASFVLLAGDIYDGVHRSVRCQLRFRRALERLDDHGIESFVVHGNHDPTDSWSAIRSWPERAHVFDADSVQVLPVVRDGVQLATVYGVSHGKSDESDNLAKKFERFDGQGIHVGLLHCTVGHNDDHAPYAPCEVAELCEVGLDYWALGHIHQHAILRSEAPWIVYPGTLQGRSPKPTELGAKGAVVVEVDGDVISDVEFVAVDSVRFLHVDFDIEAIRDLAELRDALESRLETCRDDHPGRGLIVRGTLTGRGPVFEDLKRAGVVDEILRELRDDAQGEDPVVWWESLRNDTEKTLDRERIRRRGDFSSELIRVTDDLRANREQLQVLLDEELSLLDRRGCARWMEQLDSQQWEQLLDQAERYALHLLDQEGEE